MTQAKIKAFAEHLANKLLRSGSNPAFHSWDNDKTYHLNLLLLLSSISTAVFMSFNLWYGQRLIVACSLVIIGFNCLLFLLQANQRQYIARTLTAIGYPILFFTLIVCGKGSIKAEYAFFLMILLSVIFFRSVWWQIALMCYVVVFYLLSQAILLQEFGTVPDWSTILNNTIIFLSIAFGLVFITNNFVQQIIKSNKKNKQYLAELAYSNKELKRLNYMVSHDLRTPLRHIVSFATIAQAASQQGEAPTSQEYLELIENSARELYQMTENLLALTHLNQDQLQTEKVKIRDIFHKIERQFTKLEDDTPISIHLEVGDQWLKGSSILLQMVLQNLVENGIKYNESPHKQIWLRAVEQEEDIILSVEDNGIGILPDDRQAIFAVFHRLEQQKYQGTGLGLAIAKKIIAIHQGTIEVKNGATGSLFIMRFPKAQLDENTTTTTPPQIIPVKALYQLSRQGRAIF